MLFDLSSSDYALLYKFAIQPLKSCGARVWIFGSRARGDNQPYSDIDVLYEFEQGQEPPMGLLFKIKTELEECNISVKVDLVNRKELATSYLENIEKDKVEI